MEKLKPDYQIGQVGRITRSEDGRLLVEGEYVVRSEWFDGVLTLVTASGEWLIDMPFDDFLNGICGE